MKYKTSDILVEHADILALLGIYSSSTHTHAHFKRKFCSQGADGTWMVRVNAGSDHPRAPSGFLRGSKMLFGTKPVLPLLF